MICRMSTSEFAKYPGQEIEEQRKVTATAGRYWLPTRPYDVIAAVNRMTAATGSTTYALQATGADYNGHSVQIALTDRGYWTATYMWARIVTIGRGSVEDCLRAGAREHRLGRLGSEVRTPDLTPEEARVALSLGYMPHTPEGEVAWLGLWHTDRHELVGQAVDDLRHGQATIHHLIAASSAQDYRVRCRRDEARRWGAGSVHELRGPAGEHVVIAVGQGPRAGRACITTLGRDGRLVASPAGRTLNISNARIEDARAEWDRLLDDGFCPVGDQVALG